MARFNVWLLLPVLLLAFAGIKTDSPENISSVAAVTDKPNIILFLVDDMGWQDTSVPFHSVVTPFNQIYRTPNMERLARQGMLFTNAYAASPVCTPTRTSIMTGRNPARTRITNWTLRNSREDQETGPANYPLRSPDWRFEGLQPGDVTLPAVLQENGYQTIHAGKAHFGALDTPGADPTNLGFAVNIAGHAAGAPGSYYGIHNFGRSSRGGNDVWDVPGLETYHGRGINLTEVLTHEANRAIEDAVLSGQPFFLNMAHYGVHTPIMADSQYVDHYAGMPPVEAAYASMLEGMDASLGSILHQLENLNQATRTLIVFFSDNGGLSAHTRGATPMGTGLNTHNLPLRSGKGSAYEGGIRVPMIVSWAKRNDSEPMQQALNLPAGARIDTPVISDDFFTTFLEIAKVRASGGYKHDGRGFWSSEFGVRGSEFGVRSSEIVERREDRVLGWHYPHKWGPEGPGTDPFTAVRKGDWKLIYFYKDDRYELYNLANDLGETTDLAWKQPEALAEMQEVMEEWMDEMGAQVPVSK